MRIPRLFDKTLIERNLAFYKKRFNEIATDRIKWLDDNFSSTEGLVYIDIPYGLGEHVTADKITTIGDGPYKQHVVTHLAWGEEKLDKLKDCLSFRLYRITTTKQLEHLAGVFNNIEACGTKHHPRYELKAPEIINQHVVFSQMNYAMVMSLDDNWEYDTTDLYTFGLDQRRQLKLNPDRAWIASMNKGASDVTLVMLMNHLAQKKFKDLRVSFANDFSLSMVKRFVEINNDPNK